MNLLRYLALLALLTNLAFGIRTQEGSGSDPHGGPRPDAGCGIDPEGCPQTTGGPGMDPNGG